MKKECLTYLLIILLLTQTVAVAQVGSGGSSQSIPTPVPAAEVKLQRGDKVTVRNRSGSIKIVGWDRDTIEATATGDHGPEEVRIEFSSVGIGGRTWTIIPSSVRSHFLPLQIAPPRSKSSSQAAKPPQPYVVQGSPLATTPAPPVDHSTTLIVVPPPASAAPVAKTAPAKPAKPLPPAQSEPQEPKAAPKVYGPTTREKKIYTEREQQRIGNVDLNVKVPRYAIVTVSNVSGDVEIVDLEGAVNIGSTSGNILVANVGSVDIKSQSGNIDVKSVNGNVCASAISGNVKVNCAKGRVDVNSVSSAIKLSGIGGDVEATTTSGEVFYLGNVRPGGRYRLKAMSGEVIMAIQSESPGFTATLSSYSGDIETDFPLTLESPIGSSPVQRRITGRYGDGNVQIQLDSFNGTVKLSRSTDKTRNCQ